MFTRTQRSKEPIAFNVFWTPLVIINDCNTSSRSACALVVNKKPVLVDATTSVSMSCVCVCIQSRRQRYPLQVNLTSVAAGTVSQAGNATHASRAPDKAPNTSGNTAQETMAAVIDPSPLASVTTRSSCAVIDDNALGSRIAAWLWLHPLLLWLHLQSNTRRS